MSFKHVVTKKLSDRLGAILQGSLRVKLIFSAVLCFWLTISAYGVFNLVLYLFPHQYFKVQNFTQLHQLFIIDLLFLVMVISFLLKATNEIIAYHAKRFIVFIIFTFCCSSMISAYAFDLKSVASGPHFALVLIFSMLLFGSQILKLIFGVVVSLLICGLTLISLGYVPSSPFFIDNILMNKEGFFVYTVTVSLNAGLSIGSLFMVYDQFMIFRQSRESALKKISETDELTQLYNRYETQNFFYNIVQSPNTHPISIILTDIDYFKNINDRYGHHVGDLVLQTYGRTLNEFCPEGACVGRQGGEEFLMILPNCTLQQAHQLAEKIRLAFTYTNITTEQKELLKLTASFGVAMLKPQQTFEHIYKEADTRLYFAKSNGRNQVVSHQLVV